MMNAINADEAYSFHSGGINMVMVDGSVTFTNESISTDVFVSLTTRKGGEITSER